MSCSAIYASVTTPLQAQGQVEAIATALAETGWCVTDAFLPPPLVAALRNETQALLGAGTFHRAGIGRGAELQVRDAVRGDQVLWLDAATATPAQRAYLEAIEGLRQTLNRMLFLGLFDFEGHLASYPPGSFYRRHLDRFRGAEVRTVTCVCYLNTDWCEADGGQLRLYPDPDAPEVGIDVLPRGGRLVSFLSDGLPHEVLPARRERISITGWLKRRPDGG
jgi:SM-20-related protein